MIRTFDSINSLGQERTWTISFPPSSPLHRPLIHLDIEVGIHCQSADPRKNLDTIFAMAWCFGGRERRQKEGRGLGLSMSKFRSFAQFCSTFNVIQLSTSCSCQLHLQPDAFPSPHSRAYPSFSFSPCRIIADKWQLEIVEGLVFVPRHVNRVTKVASSPSRHHHKHRKGPSSHQSQRAQYIYEDAMYIHSKRRQGNDAGPSRLHRKAPVHAAATFHPVLLPTPTSAQKAGLALVMRSSKKAWCHWPASGEGWYASSLPQKLS